MIEDKNTDPNADPHELEEEQNFQQTKQEIEASYKRKLAALEESREKRLKITEKADREAQTTFKLNKELASLNVQVESKKLKLNEIMSEGSKSNIGMEEINTKCNNILDLFISEVDNVSRKLSIKIQYKKIILIHELIEEDLTFNQLKTLTKQQFNKSEDEFFFADSKENIYLDNLLIKKALFPISSIKIKGQIPEIYVIEKKTKEYWKEIELKNKKDNDNIIKDDNFVKKEPPRSAIQKFGDFFLNRKLIIFQLICWVIYICLFYEHCYLFNDLDNKIFNRQEFTQITQNTFNNSIKENDLLEGVKVHLGKLLDFTSEEVIKNTPNYVFNSDKLDLFNQQTINLRYCRLTKKDYDTTIKNCTLNNRTGNFYVYPCKVDELKVNIPYKNTTLNYTDLPGTKTIRGYIKDYDNDGFSIDIDLVNSNSLYNNINDLIDNNFINSDTNSLRIQINFYNLNNEYVFLFEILYERIADTFFPHINIRLLNLHKYDLMYLIISMLFALVLFITELLGLYSKGKEESKEDARKRRIEGFSCKKFLKESIYEGILKRFRLPTLFEFCSLFTLIYSFGIAIKQDAHIERVKNISFNVNSFNNFQPFINDNKNIMIASSVVFYLNIITLFRFVSNFSEEMELLQKALFKMLKYLAMFIILFYVVFIIVNIVSSYYLFGDYVHSIYRTWSYHIVSVFENINRGSVDNKEFSNSYYNMDPGNSYDKFKEIAQYAESSLFNLLVYSNRSVYNLFAIISYLISFSLIKVVNLAVFLVLYRNEYIDKQKEIAYKKMIEMRDNIK